MNKIVSSILVANCFLWVVDVGLRVYGRGYFSIVLLHFSIGVRFKVKKEYTEINSINDILKIVNAVNLLLFCRKCLGILTRLGYR
jgi:hypothetical protein